MQPYMRASLFQYVRNYWFLVRKPSVYESISQVQWTAIQLGIVHTLFAPS